MTPATRYEPLVKIASGGMATVFVGLARGALGFQQLVALKCPHPALLDDDAFRAALLVEARIASQLVHANLVGVRDIDVEGESIRLVMEYIEGASLGELLVAHASGRALLPSSVAVRVVLDACAGLHALHELCDASGRPAGLVHRDVSPQNVLLGLDGVARVTDFGLAKGALGGDRATTDGTLRGKLGYLAPEAIRGRPLDRRADVFALGVVLWEALAGARLFRGANEAETLERVAHHVAPPISSLVPALGEALDGVLAAALSKAPSARIPTADAMRRSLESAARQAQLTLSYDEVARCVLSAVGSELEGRRTLVRERLASLAPMGETRPGGAAFRYFELVTAGTVHRSPHEPGAGVDSSLGECAAASGATPSSGATQGASSRNVSLSGRGASDPASLAASSSDAASLAASSSDPASLAASSTDAASLAASSSDAASLAASSSDAASLAASSSDAASLAASSSDAASLAASSSDPASLAASSTDAASLAASSSDAASLAASSSDAASLAASSSDASPLTAGSTRDRPRRIFSRVQLSRVETTALQNERLHGGAWALPSTSRARAVVALAATGVAIAAAFAVARIAQRHPGEIAASPTTSGPLMPRALQLPSSSTLVRDVEMTVPSPVLSATADRHRTPSESAPRFPPRAPSSPRGATSMSPRSSYTPPPNPY